MQVPYCQGTRKSSSAPWMHLMQIAMAFLLRLLTRPTPTTFGIASLLPLYLGFTNPPKASVCTVQC
eukprot:3438545-Amphidinium_carterae.1